MPRTLSPNVLMGRSRSPAPPPNVLHRRNRSPAPQITDEILFPASYEDAWEKADVGDVEKTNLQRTRNFLLRLAMDTDPTVMFNLWAVTSNEQNCTVVRLAAAIQTKIFGGRHASFQATPFMQVVRFMLLKTCAREALVSDYTKSVLDFFFDPTIGRILSPLPDGPLISFQYPAGRLKVAIIGGGPTALATAISLAEKGGAQVEVHVYERRWVRKENTEGEFYFVYSAAARRRDQVVTLQDHVTSLLSERTFQVLFAGRPERVWPGSANIQIRKVENRLLRRVQDTEFDGTIHLHPEGMTQEDSSDLGDFHVLVGADGAASWVRSSIFHGYENESGRSYALGVAFDRPAGLPFCQPLNVFLTLGQTRYLLNASDYDGRGYLNMQLTEEEWNQMLSIDGQEVNFGRPGCLRRSDGSIPEGFTDGQVFAPSQHASSPLWISISDGLKLFGFQEEEVVSIVRIPIVVQAVKQGAQILPAKASPSIKRPHALVAVAGDAAMTVHFWPGRGLNSGIKSGLALGDEIVHALNNKQFVGLPLESLGEYNDFILKLQDREQDKRSVPILNQSGSPEMLGWLMEKAAKVPDMVAIEWLVGAMKKIAMRMERRNDWEFEPVANLETQLRVILRQLESTTLKAMAVSFPWPTSEMAGAEILPVRSIETEEKQKWLRTVLTSWKSKARRTSQHLEGRLVGGSADQ